MEVPVLGHRYVFGKLVQSPEGPVRAGVEHGCTGRSTGFPESLEPYCHPARIGIGEDPRFTWDAYPWRESGGGLVVVPVLPGDEVWVLASRHRHRSEQGERAGGRRYLQAEYLAMPARRWVPGCLPELLRKLRADPMTGPDPDLAPLELVPHTRDLPLSEGWIEELRPALEVLLAGSALSFQDWDRSLDDFVGFVTLVEASLPASLRWRLSVAAGAVTMEGEQLLSLGVRAGAIPRVIRGVWRGLEALDRGPGSAYVRWLEAVASSASNLQELIEAVDGALPGPGRWDGIDPHRSWLEACRELAESCPRGRS